MSNKHGITSTKETFLEQSFRTGAIALLSIFALVCIIGNISAQHSNVAFFIISALCSAVILWAFAAVSEKTLDSYKTWVRCIFLIAFILRLIAISVWPIEPSSDFKSTYDAALTLANSSISDISSLMSNKFGYYYTDWSAYVPFILIKTFIIKIFGEGYYPIQVFLTIFSSLSCAVSAMIAKCLYGRRAGIATGLIMCMLPTCLTYSAVLSSQHIATFFFLAAIYFIIAHPFKKRLADTALASLCTVVSQVMRPEMPVFITAVICYLIYKYIFSARNKTSLNYSSQKFASHSVMFLSIYLVLMFTVNLTLAEKRIIKDSITHTNYKYKIAVGLNTETGGLWNEEDARHAGDNKYLTQLISERTKDKPQLIKLAFNKTMYQYGTYDYLWSVEGKTGYFVENWYEPITNGFMLIILLLCFIKPLLSIYNKSRRELLIFFAMLGYFGTYMIIEVQNRYNYLVIPLFVILASGSLTHIYQNRECYAEEIKKLFKKR